MWRRHVSGDRSAGRSDRPGRVSSEKRAAASRRNGRASRGPRTAAGRAKASRNALHHGLNVPVLADPHASADARALARRIAGEGADPVLQAPSMPRAFWRNEPERRRAKSGLAKRTRGSLTARLRWLAEPKLAAAGPPSPFGLRLRERRLVPVEGVEPPCLLGDRF